jgi:hypothetical protein
VKQRHRLLYRLGVRFVYITSSVVCWIYDPLIIRIVARAMEGKIRGCRTDSVRLKCHMGVSHSHGYCCIVCE